MEQQNISLAEFRKLDKEQQAETYFQLSETNRRGLVEEWREDKKKHFKILGGMFDIIKIQTYCILCGEIRTGLISWRHDYFNGYNPEDLICPDCFRERLEIEKQESFLRKIKIISELKLR